MLFALLGPIQFELITYFDGFDGHFGANYAEHALIEGKPRIQWVGDKLDEWTIKLKFHRLYCEPEWELARLREAMQAHTPLPFVLATGEYKGQFVITSLSTTPEQTDLLGALVSVGASLTLKEHVPPPGMERVRHEAPAVRAPGKPPAPQVEKVVPGMENATAPLERSRQALGQAVGVARSAMTAHAEAAKALAAARGENASPAALAGLDTIAPHLTALEAQANALGELLDPMRTTVAGTASVVAMARRIADEASNAQAALASLSPANLQTRLDALTHGLTTAGNDLERVGPAVARLAARTAVRGEPQGELNVSNTMEGVAA